MSLVYDDLHALATRIFRRERRGHTLQPTAILHEAYMNLVRQGGLDWQNRAHFYGVAVRAMRRVLIDHARRRNRAKRGGGGVKVTFPPAEPHARAGDHHGVAVDVIALDDALAGLASLDPRKARIVELMFFGGFTTEEAVRHLGLSRATLNREWRRARAWLLYRLGEGDSDGA